MMNFECQVMQAVHHVLGTEVTTQDCFYHLTQSTWWCVQELSLASSYKSNVDFQELCGMIDGLVFLPVADISTGTAYLKSVILTQMPDLLLKVL